MSIKLLLTGGTIDKDYNEANGELHFVSTHLPELLSLGRNRANIDIQELMLKDSLKMNDSDRETIFAACQNTEQDQIMITHGTDTMEHTAQLLGKQNIKKTIILVGAMIPYVFKHSDAIFNIGVAIGALQSKPHGVYIAMNGTIFDWDNVTKNRQLGIFETL